MEAAKEKLNEEAIEKKLKSFNNSQDSVQAVSLWIMHHKAQHRKIVDTWLKVMRASEVKHKLTLFYLCNDVVQHAKRKKALYYLSGYKDILREAVYIVSEHDAIKPNIMRILNIWEERKIYDRKYVTELKGILENESGASSKNSSANATPNTPTTHKPVSKPEKREKHEKHEKAEKAEKIEEEKKVHVEENKPVMKDTLKDMSEKEREELSSRIVAEFKPTKFIDSITMLRRLEGEIDLKRKQLTTLRIDATSLEAVKQLKDRSHGKEFCKQFEDSCIKIEDYVNTLEREITQRKTVLMMCENSEIFYDEQFKEAKIVANAYKNFGARVSNMKKKVDDKKKSLPATPSPVPSPSADAPSPGNTPPLQDMDDNEQIDMDLDEEQDSSKHNEPSTTIVAGRIAYTAMVKSIDQPISSITSINMGEQGLPIKSEKTPTSEPAPVSAPVSVPEPVPAPVPNVYNPKPLDKPKIEPFSIGNVLESRIASMLPNLAKGTSTLGNKFKPIPPVQQSVQQPVQQPIQPITTTTASTAKYTETHLDKTDTEDNSDERAATPVMDEQEDEKDPSPPRPQTPEKPKPAVTTSSATTLKTNPIDFLSQLLTKTTKSSSSSNFLHSLSLLTNTVKSQYRKQQPDASGQSNTSVETPATTTVNIPASDESSPVSAAPSPVEAPLTSSWSGWKINADHPPLPPQPNTEQPPPPIPAIPITTPPPGSGHIPPQPPFPPPQMPPQPPSPLPTPPVMGFPSAPNQSYPNLPETSQSFPVPQSSGFQPHITETSFSATTPQTYTAPGAQLFEVASSQSYPVSTSQPFIDPSLPPPPRVSQPYQSPASQRFPTSPEGLPPRPTLLVTGPRPAFPLPGERLTFPPPGERPAFPPPGERPSFPPPGERPSFPPPGERPSFPPPGERPSFPPPGERPAFQPPGERPVFPPPGEGPVFPPPSERPSFPPSGDSKGYTPTTGFNQLLFSYGGARNPPPPESPQEQRPFPQAPTPWGQSGPNPPPHEQGQGFTPSPHPWDQPPPGPPLETNAPPPGQFQPQGPFTPWDQSKPQQRPIDQPPPGPPPEPNIGQQDQFPTQEAYTPWDKSEQQNINEYRDQWEQPDMELDSPPPEREDTTTPPVHSAPTPAKGILRKRNSSLKEVTLVDDTNPANDSYTSPVGHSPVERFPLGTLRKPPFGSAIKKPPTDIIQSDQPTDVQSEFIAKLKRKTGSSNLVVPPVVSSVNSRNSYSHGRVHSNLTTIEPTPAHLLPDNTNVQEEEETGNADPHIVTTYEEAEPGSDDEHQNGKAMERNLHEHLVNYQETEQVSSFEENEHISNFQEGEHINSFQRGEHLRSFQEEHIRSFQGDHIGSFQGDHISSFQEGANLDRFQQGGQFSGHEQPGEQISTIHTIGDTDRNSSNDMDLENEEENQAPENLVPENQIIETESQMQHHEKEPEISWHDNRNRQENWHPKMHQEERFFHSPRPRFDHFRPREPFRPYHRSPHDRFRGPRQRPYFQGPRPPYYRY